MAVWLIGICVLAKGAAAAAGGGQEVELAVVTRRPVRRNVESGIPQPHGLFRKQARERLVDHEEDEAEDEDEEVEYNIAAFGKDFKLQFSKNKKLLRRGFRMEWKQSDGQTTRSYLPQGADDCHYLHRNVTSGAVAAISDCRPGQLRGFVATKDESFEISPMTTADMAETFFSTRGDFDPDYDYEATDYSDLQPFSEYVGRVEQYVVKRVKLPNFSMDHELDVPDDDEGEFTFKSSAYSDVEKRKTVELALFLDHKAYSHFHLLYDKDEIVEAVLASANQLSAIYHMPSLGQMVDFSIVKLEVHEDEEPFENHEGERRRFLESFCDYSNGLNERDDRHPGHWDLGVYLTGVDLYADKGYYNDSDTLGVAYTGSMCDKKFSCVITEFGVPKSEDVFQPSSPTTGFSAVYVLAHEIGHTLGMRHDGFGINDDSQPKGSNDCDLDGFIMSPRRDDSETKWSTCSAEYLKSFSKNCLDDEPGLNREDFQHERFGGRPGMYFGADSQCKLFLVDKFAMKSPSTDDVCQKLWCVHSDVALLQSHGGLKFNAGPALDGTECDIDGFCLGGECVHKKRWYVNSIAEEYYGECKSGCLERSMGVRKKVLVYDEHKVKNREPLSVTEELCRDQKTCSHALSELATITLGFLSFSKGNSNFELKTNERRESRRDYATAKCRRILADEKTAGMPAIHSEENPAQACMLFCRRESPAAATTSARRHRRHRRTRWKSLLQRLQKNEGWVDDLSEAHFPDGTWCHRDVATGEDFFCLNKECKSLEREKERADADRSIRNLRSRLLFQ